MSTETVQSPSSATEPVATAPKNRLGTLLLWLVVFGVLGLVGWGLLNANATRPEPGQPAPAFQMEYFDGYEWQDLSTASLEDMRGQVVILNFWASWCVECRLEADLLEQVWRQYKDDGVVMLGIAYADVEPNALGYLEEFNVTYPNAPDLRTAISADYEITGVPETFFIGKDGVIAHVQIGPVNEATLFTLIDRLLADS
jgi:cytochrome c biogenesis protein CcmG, thiol:disulfide interchange protein DsbE